MAENRFVSEIRRHPTASFFLFAFVIYWTAWFLSPTLVQLNTAVSSFVNLTGSFGPAFSAILVSAILNPEPSGASTKKRLFTFAVVFAASFISQWIAAVVFETVLDVPAVFFAGLNSLIAAYVVSSIYHRKRGVVDLLVGLKRVSPRSVWLWLALLLPFVWQFLGAAVDLSLGGNELFTLTPATLLVVVGNYPFIVFFGGGLNEEPGWRGFAVPRMQRQWSPLVAGLIIGVVWSAWHFPLYATGNVDGGMASFPFRFIYNVPLGVLFSWLYNRSGGKLFACMLLHASYNSASAIFGNETALVSMGLMIVFVVFVAVYDRMWLRSTASSTNAAEITPPSSTQRDIAAT
jgi:membrane protease YdiL (CAAX protease family)